MAVVASILICSGCASAKSATCSPYPSSLPAVPHRVQAAIKRFEPRFAYVPTRLPPGSFGYGFRFGTWGVGDGGEFQTPRAGERDRRGSGFAISLNQKGNSVPGLITYSLAPRGNCQSFGSSEYTFTINGVKVSWTGAAADQEAWRCVGKGTTRFVVAATGVDGGDNPRSGRGHKNALGLACVLAYIRPAS
jgi:hypothetical protein